MAAEIPYFRQISAVFEPASCSFSIPMICSSEKREGFIRRLLRDRLYPFMEEVQGLRSRALAGSKPIVFVMGNHEHWNGEINENLAPAKLLAAQSGISLLEESSADIAGCRFVGATLWSDYTLAGDPSCRAETGEQVDVQHAGGSHLITVGDARRLHARSRSRLGELLSQPGSLPMVVVTHHAPHPVCIAEPDRGTWAAGNSASDLSDLTDRGKAALWIHGHVHRSVNIQRPNGTRIICNPAGPLFCNTAFDEGLVVLV
ncbi:hypothetical protein BOSEA31B_15136 [Hyphomicrobiales bacterium]|nr:hypothetical protein BOSEA31B_15136 [Hyphomicrobiales bacterium]CAH1701627.1 hypothetical protein BOSEA1005_21326 [Hyphomicrobiales bacterium]CAI0345793.1 hypothetical protein BO1005MUT1_450021 [Hyphomicrobiales bacterium]